MFYKNIAKVYDYIFPPNEIQLEFIESVKKIDKNEFILDVGCATGNLTQLLLKRTVNCVGVDLDRDLLYIAKNKGIKVEEIDMLGIDRAFEESKFDRIVSFGNTLVHLNSITEVKEYFEKVYKLLKNDGLFIVQIINYDRIIEKEIKNLPTIDNQYINFIRNYEVVNDKVQFKTSLTLKKENEVIENCIELLALRKKTIEDELRNLKFSDVKFYGDFKGNSLDENSEALIFVAKKTSIWLLVLFFKKNASNKNDRFYLHKKELFSLIWGKYVLK